jgi:hypothetical protein
MQLFEINYSLGSYAGNNDTGAFNSTSSAQNLSTTVTANGIAQARAMVEGMYGSACQIHYVRPV